MVLLLEVSINLTKINNTLILTPLLTSLGVVGTKRPQWTIFGDAVNTASRMESTSKQMMIQCSDLTHRLLQDAPDYKFDFTDRGHVEAKGKGKMHTWFIDAAKLRSELDHNPQDIFIAPITMENLSKHDDYIDVEHQQEVERKVDDNELKDIDISGDNDECGSVDSMSPMDTR